MAAARRPAPARGRGPRGGSAGRAADRGAPLPATPNIADAHIPWFLAAPTRGRHALIGVLSSGGWKSVGIICRVALHGNYTARDPPLPSRPPRVRAPPPSHAFTLRHVQPISRHALTTRNGVFLVLSSRVGRYGAQTHRRITAPPP